jgi:Ca2+-binding EF-hand superfamily protein
LLLLLTPWLVAAGGCRQPSGTPSKQTTGEQSAEGTAPPASDQADKTPPAETAEPAAPSTTPSPATETSSSPPTPTEVTVPEEPPAVTYRLLLLLPGAPLLCDTHLAVDRQPLQRHLQTLTAELVQLADTDGDGEVSWQEATTSPRLMQGQLGNQPIEGPDQGQQIVYRCDINRNGRMDEDEVAGFLAPPGEPSHWVNPLDGRGTERADASVLFDWFDTNGDGVLDADEVRQLPPRLRLLDRDDDGIVARDELVDRSAADQQNAPRDRRTRILLLQDDSAWSRVLYAVEDEYALGSPLQADDLGGRAELFRFVDVNEDGTWDVSEVPRLLSWPADVTLDVAFGDADEALRVEWMSAHGLPSGAPHISGSTATIGWSGCELVIQVVGDGTSRYDDAEWSRLWQQWDGNQDNVLDAQEYAAAPLLAQIPLAGVDTDGDQRVASSEALEVLRRRERFQRGRVRIVLQDEAWPLWTWLDRDRDGRLSEREMRDGPSRLGELAPADGAFVLGDFPVTVRLSFALGAAGDAPASEPALAEKQTSARRAPRWFEQMDQNRDGEVSQREFLGSASDLQRLDGNADGVLQAEEVAE